MLRRALYLSVFVCVGAVVVMYLGSGSHTLVDPSPSARPSLPPPSPAYVYAGAVEPHTSSYVRPAVLSYLEDVPAGASVLDLGCGTGGLASLADRRWQRTGLDVSPMGIAAARRAHADIRFVEADATGDLTTVIEMGTFDVVVSTETLEHVTLPRSFVANAFDALKPGGRLVLSVPYNGYLKHLGVALLGRGDQYFDPLWDWGHIKFFSVKTMAAVLWDAGFEGLEYQGAGRLPYLWKSMVFVAYKPITTPQK